MVFSKLSCFWSGSIRDSFMLELAAARLLLLTAVTGQLMTTHLLLLADVLHIINRVSAAEATRQVLTVQQNQQLLLLGPPVARGACTADRSADAAPQQVHLMLLVRVSSSPFKQQSNEPLQGTARWGSRDTDVLPCRWHANTDGKCKCIYSYSNGPRMGARNQPTRGSTGVNQHYSIFTSPAASVEVQDTFIESQDDTSSCTQHMVSDDS